MKPISIHDFLLDPSKFAAKEICVVFGEDDFLKSQAVRLLREQVLKNEDAEFSLTRFDGNSVPLKDVLKEVATQAMFGGDRRLVIIDDADSFVTKNREALEDYTETPSKRAVLLLKLQKFPATTRFFKRMTEMGLILEAKALPEKEFVKWITQWSKHRYKTPCDSAAADEILKRIGPEYGLVDQELAKLATIVLPDKGKITIELVETAVGSWRSQTVFEMLNLALEGKTAEAIRQLDNLLLSGETANGILAPISSSLRKFAAATRLIIDAEKSGRKTSVNTALEQAGVNKYYIDQSAKQLRMLGRHRGDLLLDWLLQADLDLKGASKNNPRFIIETFIIKIADPRLRVPNVR